MRTPFSARRTAIRQPSAVLPGPYMSSTALLSLLTSNTSGASVCMRKAVSMVLMEASSCESFSPSFGQIHLVQLAQESQDRAAESPRRCRELVTLGITLAASNGSPSIHSFLTYVPW